VVEPTIPHGPAPIALHLYVDQPAVLQLDQHVQPRAAIEYQFLRKLRVEHRHPLDRRRRLQHRLEERREQCTIAWLGEQHLEDHVELRIEQRHLAHVVIGPTGARRVGQTTSAAAESSWTVRRSRRLHEVASPDQINTKSSDAVRYPLVRGQCDDLRTCPAGTREKYWSCLVGATAVGVERCKSDARTACGSDDANASEE